MVLDTIEERAPNIRRLIAHAQVLTPKEIEDRFGLSEGNIFQGELSLEQLFFNRPVAGWARYRTPLRNLWMCGSATHPGGGIMGASGRLAALQVVRSLRSPTGGLRLAVARERYDADHRGCGPQRPGDCGVPGEGRAPHARSRAPEPCGRCARDRGRSPRASACRLPPTV